MHRVLTAATLLLVSAVLASADELRTLGGKQISGTLTSITDTEVILKTADGEVKTPLSQILALDVRKAKDIAPDAKVSAVRLLDDTVLQCQSVKFLGNDVALSLYSGVTLKLPLQNVVWILHDAQDAAIKKRFDEMLAEKVRRDRIVILREGVLNSLDGTLGEVDAKGTTIQFKRDGTEAIGVLFERLHGLIFFRNESVAEQPICRVYDEFGNMLIATKLGFASGNLTVSTSFGAKVTLGYASLAKLDFNLGRLTFLSDLEPAKLTYTVKGYRPGYIPLLAKNTNIDGEPIVIQDKKYDKGVSLPSNSDVQFNLGGKYKEFKAILGVSAISQLDATKVQSNAVVTVYCDGEKVFSHQVSAKEPKAISLSVKDAKTLRITVTSRNLLGAMLGLHDHATLAEARVSQ
ncbi:MAG: NPCBM/NEW2 domain-containing protein [Gemmataceae bacterium]|nr:NPCBM/NEW2 domain-containing protein [Gemmataceae bacterium]